MIQFPYECPRCGARGELSLEKYSLDPQRDIRELRSFLRCPGCGKRPRTWMARVIATAMIASVLPAALVVFFALPLSKVAPIIVIFCGILLVQISQVRRAGRPITIRLAASIPEARAIAMPDTPPSRTEPPIVPPEPGAEPNILK